MVSAQDTAERKGYKAGLRGDSKESCPYRDIRAGAYDQVVTWSRGFINAWERGWERGHKEHLRREEKRR